VAGPDFQAQLEPDRSHGTSNEPANEPRETACETGNETANEPDQLTAEMTRKSGLQSTTTTIGWRGGWVAAMRMILAIGLPTLRRISQKLLCHKDLWLGGAREELQERSQGFG